MLHFLKQGLGTMGLLSILMMSANAFSQEQPEKPSGDEIGRAHV